MKKQTLNHTLVTTSEIAVAENTATICDAEDIALDIKYLISEYYNAFLKADGRTLSIKFNNGQKFLVTVEER